MTEMTDVAPFLHVDDAEAAAAFYTQKLGFEQNWDYRPSPDQPVAVVGLQYGNVRLYLSSLSEVAPEAKLMFWLTDLDAYARQLTDNGASFEDVDLNSHFGARELRVHDLDGNYLLFSSRNLLRKGSQGPA